MEQIPPEVVGDSERFPALWLRENFCKDPLDLLKFHPARALTLQCARHGPCQSSVGQLLQRQARQFYEKKSAVRDESSGPVGDFRRDLYQIPETANGTPISRSGVNHDRNHKRELAAGFDFSGVLLPDQPMYSSTRRGTTRTGRLCCSKRMGKQTGHQPSHYRP